MQRRVRTDHKFDKKGFANALNLGRGIRTHKQFANECGISQSFLSKYINQKFDEPPLPVTIAKISQHCQNGITYTMLLQFAGYNPNKYMSFSYTPPANHQSKEDIEDEISTYIVRTHIKQRRLWQNKSEYYMDNGDDYSIHDFALQVFDTISKKTITRIYDYYLTSFSYSDEKKLVFEYIGKIHMTHFDDSFEFFVVSDSLSFIENFLLIKPQLNIQLSLLYWDMNKNIVSTEINYNPSIASEDDIKMLLENLPI